MRSTFLQIRLIFSSPEGYWLQFSIPRAYFVYAVWHCTGQHCSSMYACMYRLFASMWRPLVSVITTLCYVMKIIFHRRVWYRALSLCYACIQSSGSILIPSATFVPNFISFAASIAEPAHREKPRTQSHSLNHPAYLMSREPKLVLWNILVLDLFCKNLWTNDKCLVLY